MSEEFPKKQKVSAVLEKFNFKTMQERKDNQPTNIAFLACTDKKLQRKEETKGKMKRQNKRKKKKTTNASYTHLRCRFRIALFSRSAPARPVNPYLQFQKHITTRINFNLS